MASLRASATFAFFMPARLASFVAQLLRPARQDDVGGLIESGAHASVADLADPPGDIRLAGPVFLRRQAKMRSDPFRRRKPRRTVDRANIGQRHDRPVARHGTDSYQVLMIMTGRPSLWSRWR